MAGVLNGAKGRGEGLLMLVDVSEAPAWVIWASVTLYIRQLLFGFNEGHLRVFIINHFPINAEREHKVGN